MSGVVNAFVSVAMGRQERSGCRDGVVGEGERGEGTDSGAPALLSRFDHFPDFQPFSIVSFFHFFMNTKQKNDVKKTIISMVIVS